MLRSVKSLLGFKIKAADGDIGKVVDFYYDDENWTIRYLVADISGLLTAKKVLISPAAFKGEPDWENKEFPVAISVDMVKKSPDIDTDRPISRVLETTLANYYSWPLYWSPSMAGLATGLTEGPLKENIPSEKQLEEETHLRSCQEAFGYSVKAKDGEIGKIVDIITDGKKWSIVYAVVDTGNWLPGRQVLISSKWITGVSWGESSMIADLSLKQIKDSPPYDPQEPINREYENKLYDYYGRPK